MTTYKSNYSKSVRLISILGTFLILTIILSIFTTSSSNISSSIKIGLTIFLILITLFFVTSSLKKIEITNDNIILKKQFSQKQINFNTIIKAERIPLSNLTATYSSKGFFGYNGSLMDGSISIVNDRTKMIKITTTNETYILSCNNPEQLVLDINKHMK